VVLRLEARHDKVELACRESEVVKPVRRGVVQNRGAIGDEFGGNVELVRVVIGDALRVGDERVGVTHRELLRPAVVAAAVLAPLATLPLEAVDVHGRGDALHAQCRQEGRVGGVEEEGDILLLDRGEVTHREGGVAERLDGLRAHRGKVHQIHAEVAVAGLVALAASAVHRDLVAAGCQALADLLDRGLESAVGRRYSARAQHGDPE
jgi:hypothetical protein